MFDRERIADLERRVRTLELRREYTEIMQAFHVLNAKMETIMSTLKDVQDAVTAEDTVIDSAITLLQGIAAKIAALQPNQAAIDALAADVKGKTQNLADALVANTPAAP